ncbi:hypothetical protein [Pseudaminobacter soli (ex Li et al. 2025)]|uniref:DUF4148 domain-containing protein n=1 Tax=Pseudaminobacter soli (ex Li et al. 2025) TaxID=1295366 RepID=A0A2P7SNM8_9HYPH|nr:hypothetical protein [Mesorhizobium soli]PSJ64047.1 hypothetical protein C7I85_02760 [Mesorhizobium soli]
MKKTIIALTAVVMTAGAAFAQSNLPAQPNTMRDFAPASVVVKPSLNSDYSSSNPVTSPVGATNQQERAKIIEQRANNR